MASVFSSLVADDMKEIRKEKSQAFKIGLTVLVSLFLLYFGINFLNGSKIFDKTNTYYIVFKNSGGLEPSSHVSINGFKVGKVSKLDFDYSGLGDIIIELSLNKNLEIPEGTYGTVKNSITGGSSIDLIIPKDEHNKILQPGDTLKSYTGRKELFSTVQDEIVPNISQITSKLDTLITGMNKIISAPQIPTTIEAVNRSAHSLQSTTAQLNALMNNQIPTIVNNLETSSESISDVSQRISKVEFEAILQDFTKVVADLKKVSTHLNDADNSLGLLLNDPLLYDQLTRASQSADSLLTDIRSNPKRYVHFSIF